MGFTVVDTKDKNDRNKDEKQVYTLSDAESDEVGAGWGQDSEETIPSDYKSNGTKRLGASREKARAADARRKEIAAQVKSANYLNIKDKK